ncbi:MAG: tetratricopeptide repeat protein [candidate division FCPU426 bacterium]
MRTLMVAVLLSSLCCPYSLLAADPEPTAVPPSLDALLAQANEWYDQRENPEAVPKAIDLYQQVLAQDPNNYQALWRLSRCCWWQGDHSPRNQQMALYDLGQQTGERARAAAPQEVDGHYWYGACVGRAAEVRGVLNSLFAIDPIRKAMETVLSLDPKHAHALYVLGVLYRKAPGWPLSCGDINKSLEYARQAADLAPNEVLTQMGLAETLLAKGDKAEAKRILEMALTLEGPADLRPETKTDKKTVQELLKKNF